MKIKQVAHHRNGISGEGFYVVTFTDDKKAMVGIVFEGEGRVAILDLNATLAGNIAFGNGNSWRGDHFEPGLRKAVENWERQQRESVA